MQSIIKSYNDEIDLIMKKEQKTRSEVINDILYKHFNERENRLSNHIVRGVENILLVHMFNSDKKIV